MVCLGPYDLLQFGFGVRHSPPVHPSVKASASALVLLFAFGASQCMLLPASVTPFAINAFTTANPLFTYTVTFVTVYVVSGVVLEFASAAVARQAVAPFTLLWHAARRKRFIIVGLRCEFVWLDSNIRRKNENVKD